MSSIQRVHRGEKLGIINEILEEDGCIVIENVLDDIRHRLLEAEICPLLAAAAPCQGNFYGFATKRLSGMIAKSPACRLMSVEPHILAVMDEFLLKSCRAYQLNLTQAIQIGPGEPQQLIHSDDLMFGVRASGTGGDDQLHVGGRRFHGGERRDAARAGQPQMAARPQAGRP